LTTLQLNWNKIGNEGVRYVCDALTTNSVINSCICLSCFYWNELDHIETDFIRTPWKRFDSRSSAIHRWCIATEQRKSDSLDW